MLGSEGFTLIKRTAKESAVMLVSVSDFTDAHTFRWTYKSLTYRIADKFGVSVYVSQ